jgi:PAS domain S-box-containing protein
MSAAGLSESTTTELSRYRTHLTALVEGSDDAIISQSLDGVIRSWNPAAERIYGYSASEAIGQPDTLIVPPELTGQALQILAQVRRGERVDHLETTRLVKGGGRRHLSLTISPMRDDDGLVQGASQIGRDITDRKNLEHQLYESNRRKDEFIAMLGHELRNPLAPIANGTLLLRRFIPEVPDIGRICDMFDRQIGTMRRLLEDLLDASRLNRGKIRFVRQALDLQPLIQTAVDGYRPAIERQQHRLSMQLPAQPLRVMGDATRLTQAIANLLSNAVKYTPAGGAIEVIATQLADEVQIQVSDSGIGIDASLLPHIFELFVQGDTGGAHPQSGLGVGLALVHGIVRAHEGRVQAFSPGKDQGAEFRLTLPSLPH